MTDRLATTRHYDNGKGILALIVFAAMSGLTGTAIAAGLSAPEDLDIVGSWLVTVTIPGAPSLTNLATYSSDGIVTSNNLPATATNPTAPVDMLYYPAGIGTGERNEDGSIRATILLLYGDIEGNLIAVETVTWDVEVGPSGQTYTGAATFVGTLPTGEDVYGKTSTIQGTRMTVQEHGVPIQVPGASATPAATPAG